jgi:hypothetical protein
MSSFNSSYSGIGDMLRADFMVEEMRTRGEAVKAAAEAAAPVYEQGPHPGRYKEAFEVHAGIRAGRKPRAHVIVENTSPEALFVEFGNKNVTAHHTLTRALDAAGDA